MALRCSYQNTGENKFEVTVIYVCLSISTLNNDLCLGYNQYHYSEVVMTVNDILQFL